MAGRAPRRRALRISSFGNVSSREAGMAVTQSSLNQGRFRPLLRSCGLWTVFGADLCSLSGNGAGHAAGKPHSDVSTLSPRATNASRLSCMRARRHVPRPYRRHRISPRRRPLPEPRVPSPPGRRCPEGADEGDAGRNQDRDWANARHRGPHPSASPPPSPIGRRKTRVAFRGDSPPGSRECSSAPLLRPAPRYRHRKLIPSRAASRAAPRHVPGTQSAAPPHVPGTQSSFSPGRRCPEGADEGDAGRNQDRDLANARHRGPHPSASPPPSPIGRRKTRVAFRGSRGSRPHQDRIVIPSSTSIPSSFETQSEAASLLGDEGVVYFVVDNIPISAILRSLFTQEGTLPERSVAGWRGGACAGGVPLRRPGRPPESGLAQAGA